MHRLRTVTLLDVSAVAGHHAMPAALLFYELSQAILMYVGLLCSHLPKNLALLIFFPLVSIVLFQGKD